MMDANLKTHYTAAELAALPLPIKLRNAACWIFSPYL